MASPGPSAQEKSLMEVSMALLVACAKRQVRQTQEQHSQMIDKAFKKLTKSRENLSRLDKNLRRLREMDHILGSIDQMTKFIADNRGKIDELTRNVEEMSQKLNDKKNCNITWAGEEGGEAVRGGDTPEFPEGVEKDVQDLTVSVNLFVDATDTYLRENCQIEKMLEISAFE